MQNATGAARLSFLNTCIDQLPAIIEAAESDTAKDGQSTPRTPIDPAPNLPAIVPPSDIQHISRATTL